MKKYNSKEIATLLFVFAFISLSSCTKFLDEKISHSSKVVSKLSDLQALLDAENVINMGGYPFLLEVGTDDYHMDFSSLKNLTKFDQDLYTFVWTDLYPSHYLGVWVNSYKPIFLSNLVLENLEKLGEGGSHQGRNIKGQALFHRAYGHFMLAQVFCVPYDKNGLNSELGIPLKHSSDALIPSKRAKIKEVYEDVLRDMSEAVELLNENNTYASRPNKAAAYAALSRIYLVMELYEEAQHAATRALQLNSELIDLNTLNLNTAFPYPALNKETIFFACGGGASLLSPSGGSYVTPELYSMFAEDDLRRTSYFQPEVNGHYSFRGNYMGFAYGTIFSGLTTSEVLLNRAECYVRNKDVGNAQLDINLLLKHRIEKESFVPIDESDPDALLRLILNERRKELINRSIRWLDLRRLNRDQRFRKTITRSVTENGHTTQYELLPDPENYVFKIPKEVVDLGGFEQNK